MNPLLFSTKALLDEETGKLLDRIMRSRVNVELTVDDIMTMAVGLMTVMELNKTNKVTGLMDIKNSVDDLKTKELRVLVEELNDKIISAFEKFGVELNFGLGLTDDEFEEFMELIESVILDGDLVD